MAYTKYGMVKRGHYCVTWCLSSHLEDELHLEHYDNWEDAYHAFRFHVFLGHGHVALSFSSFSGGVDEFRDIVRFLNWRGTPAFKWYYGKWSDLEGRAV